MKQWFDIRVPAMVLMLAACGGETADSTATAQATAESKTPAASQVTAQTVATGLSNPWSMAFLPDGRILVTERLGQLRIVSRNGTVSGPLGGIPAVSSAGQGGLLDIILSPNFADDKLIYFSFSEPVAGGLSRTAVARAVLGETAVSNLQIIFRQTPASSETTHFGSRLVFGRDGNLFVSLGERSDKYRAQELGNHLGKVIRISPDGTVPADNPFVGIADALPEIYSLGHRNPQGAALHPQTGQLWLNEHGPQGGDEVNIVGAGKNYGWPIISYGREYSNGAPIGEGTSKSGIESPRYFWVPVSIAPSGLAFYTGDAVPIWKNSVFVGALAGKALIRLSLNGDQVIAEERLLTDLGERIRDVRMAPDGALYVLTDNSAGRLLKVIVN
jgi:aldose sugar dehydrogenase